MAVLFLVVVVDLIGFGLYIPLLPLLGEHFGASPAQVGVLIAVYSLCQFIAAPFWGAISDKIGRKPVLMTGMAGAALAYTALAFSSGFWGVLLARAVGGLMAGNIAAAFAAAADLSDNQNRARAMGVVGAAFGTGFVLGPALGGVLGGADVQTIDFFTPAIAAASLSGIAFLLCWGLLRLPENKSAPQPDNAGDDPTPTRGGALRAMLMHPMFGRLLGFVFISTVVFASLETTFVLWSKRAWSWGPWQNGWVFACVGLVCALIQGMLIGPLTRRFGERLLIIQGATILGIGLVLIPLVGTYAISALVGAMLVAASGYSIMTPALNSMISKNADTGRMGATFGVTRAMSTLARVVGPLSGGVIFLWWGMNGPYYVGAVLMAGIAGYAASISVLRQRAPEPIKSDQDTLTERE